MNTPKDPYASEAETQAMLVPDTRTEAERKLAQMMTERGADEQGAEAYPILRQIALDLIEARPTFTGLPKRKLYELLNGGWRINGVSIERAGEDGTVRRGAVTTGGMVLWWNQPERAQPPVQCWKCNDCNGMGMIDGAGEKCIRCAGTGEQVQPVVWFHEATNQAFTSEPPPGVKVQCRALVFADTAPPPSQPEQAQPLRDYVAECFDAAFAEGLAETLANTTDERLKDLVERRLMYAYHAAQSAPPPRQPEPPKRPPNCGTGYCSCIECLANPAWTDEKKTPLEHALDLIRAQKAWIMAVPDDTVLPTMPGFDREEADSLEAFLAERVAFEKGLNTLPERDALVKAITMCPHTITDGRITLEWSSGSPGTNTFNQLCERVLEWKKLFPSAAPSKPQETPP